MTLKPEDTIVQAHDLLWAVVMGEVPNPFPGHEQELRSALNALCWVLGHDHNKRFAHNLKVIDKKLQERGYHLIPITGDPSVDDS